MTLVDKFKMIVTMMASYADFPPNLYLKTSTFTPNKDRFSGITKEKRAAKKRNNLRKGKR